MVTMEMRKLEGKLLAEGLFMTKRKHPHKPPQSPAGRTALSGFSRQREGDVVTKSDSVPVCQQTGTRGQEKGST